MHPSIRILCCVLFITLVSHATWLQLGLYSIVLSALHLSVGSHTLISSFIMIKRLRWLLLSIIMLSLWFTPGEALLNEYEKWSPTKEGLEFGLLRIAILVEIVLAVNIMLLTTSTERLIAALQWLLHPLIWTGITSDKLALRIAMTLEAVKHPFIDMSELVKRSQGKSVWHRITYVVSHAYINTLSEGGEEKQQSISIVSIGHPAIAQWLWLPALVVVYYIPMVVF